MRICALSVNAGIGHLRQRWKGVLPLLLSPWPVGTTPSRISPWNILASFYGYLEDPLDATAH
jgi:hypothetical protein